MVNKFVTLRANVSLIDMSVLRVLGLAVLVVLGVLTSQGRAQEKNLLAFTVGGEFEPTNSLASAPSAIQSSTSLSLELNYGREVHAFRHSELWLDVPALVGPNHRFTDTNAQLPTSNATFYVTPSARVAFPVARGVTPWASFGGGYGLYETSDRFQGGGANPTIHTHTGTLQFGGGVDVKTPLRLLVPIGLRGEFRDFYTLREPIFAVPVTEHSQHNLTVSGGITIRF